MTGSLSPTELFRDFEAQGIVTVAVSGGGDSLALLLLAHAWAQINDLTLHAVTVDHGLRPEAAAEAAFVAGVCEGLGIDHTTLGWEGIKPWSGIAEAARRARYQLIEEFSQAIGSHIILVAHTADDQAETVAMRLSRAPGGPGEAGFGRGLAGMARVSRLPGGLLLGRPLVGVSRARLRAYLASLPQSWIEDPTNDDPAFERVRVRRKLAAEPVLSERLVRFSGVMGRMRHVLARDAAILLGEAASVAPGPVFMLRNAPRAPRPVAEFALQVLVALAGGDEHLVSRQRIGGILSRLGGTPPARATIGGAVIERTAQGLRLWREMRNIGTVTIEPGETHLWDGRLEIVNEGRETLRVGPLARAGLTALEAQRRRPIETRPRAALISTALVRTATRALLPLVEADAGGRVRTRMTARAIEHFCADSDFPILDWMRTLDRERKACLLPRP